MTWRDNFPKENRYFETHNGVLYCGDALRVLKEFPDNSIDAVVTDPPYGLRFMGQKWDYDVPGVELWKEVFRVLKPGGHLLSFFGARTYHRGVVNIEDAGFEIRDMVLYLYGSGFPKSMDISKAIDKEFGKLEEREIIGYQSKCGYKTAAENYQDNQKWSGKILSEPVTPEAKQWHGWGTALKPACEPIVLARKPISEKNIAQNVLKWGTGGLNIDECRIPTDEKIEFKRPDRSPRGMIEFMGSKEWTPYKQHPLGRFPANVILDEEAAKMLDRQSGVGKSNPHPRTNSPNTANVYGRYNKITTSGYYGDSGGASRFFYTAKAGRKERYFYCRTCGQAYPAEDYEKHKDHDVVWHPTVKPLSLIIYLARLITPPDGIVLDPFFGTGTLGVAAESLNLNWVGIDLSPEYCEIAKRRLNSIMRQRKLF